MTAEEVFLLVQKDLGGVKNCKKLDSIDSPIEEGWYMVALMCSPVDYHFIRKDDNGWYNKSGSDPNFAGCYIPKEMVNSPVWYPVGVVDGEPCVLLLPIDEAYYRENGPIYFAVRIGWDE